MRWIGFAIVLVLATVLVARYIDRPSPVSLPPPNIEEQGEAGGLRIDRIRDHVQSLSSVPSRVTGYPGSEEAAEYIIDKLAGIGITDVELHEFDVVVPIVEYAFLESPTAGGVLRIDLHPLWPNLARTCRTPSSGIAGPIVDVGSGSESELTGKRIADSIVVLDWDSDIEWLSVPEFGGRAIIFRGRDVLAGGPPQNKFLSVPADIPRFYVAQEDTVELDRLLADERAEPVIHCSMSWERAKAKNILALVAEGAPTRDDADNGAVVFHAYYDSISVVPDLSPGAEQACGAGALLELTRLIKAGRKSRPVYVLFTGAHGQACSGMTRFISKLKKGLDTEWRNTPEGSLIARMGRPGIFVGLDLSTRSESFGVFCLGSLRGQWEQLIRHKFSALGTELDKYAKSFQTGVQEESATPQFVDCINLTMGRGWWTFFPFRAAFESELPTIAGFPGITLATLNDDRSSVDTPNDTFDRLRFDLLEEQIVGRRGRSAGLGGIAQALTEWKGPFVNAELYDRWAVLQGRAVWLDQRKNYTPDEPLANATVFLKTLRGDKRIVGTRGIPAAMTDEKGRFSFDGLIQAKDNWEFKYCLLEAYGTADSGFLAANPAAMTHFRTALRKGGREDLAVEADGSILFALDMAREVDFPWRISMEKAEQHLNIVCFPCKAFSLLGLTDPRGYIPLKTLTILEAATKSPPFQFGRSITDTMQRDPAENLVTLWADPTIRTMLTLSLGFEGKRLVLINNSPDLPEGNGFVMDELRTLPSMVLQGARDMWNLDESRIAKLERNAVRNPRVRALHDQAKAFIEQAEAALTRYDYATYRNAAEKGWALEGKAYSETLAMVNNMINGILFYLALLLPLSYCLERLLVASETIKKRITWICIIFSTSFALLALVHPAFRFTLTPFLVLLAFIILALVVTVSVLIVSRMDSVLQERKLASVGRHEDRQKAGGIAVRALDLGISNIRRRPQRGFLTGLTVVMVTFILLSFTSMVPTTSISKLRHPEGRPTYKGLLARNRAWEPLPNALYESLDRNFGGRDDSARPGDDDAAVVTARSWFFSDRSGKLSQIDLTAVSEAGDQPKSTFTAVALACFEPDEVRVSGVDTALLEGRWFEDEDEAGIILARHVAEQLGYDSGAIGRKVRIFGRELPIVGIIHGKKFDEIRDIDGEPLTPVNFVRQQQMMAQMAQEGQDPSDVSDTLAEYVHYASDQIAILPFKLGQRMGAAIRSVAIKAGADTDIHAEAEGYATRSNLTILGCDGDDVVLYAALDTNQMSAAWQIVVPLLLGFIIILGTMLGSVYERTGEIFVYNSVGLSPRNVSSLFLAESSVYAIVGAGTGYLLGQAASRGLQATGLLSGLSLNYTAGSAIFVTFLTMLIVVLSALYPARQAFHAAIPDVEKEVEADGGMFATDTISIFLPFVATAGNVLAMQAYMHEFLESIQGVTIGQLAVDNLQVRVEHKDGRDVPVLLFRAWMAPFDLGVSHDAELRIVFREDRGTHQYHLTATRVGGDHQNWRRLTPRFIESIRKQLLMWRIVLPDDNQRYQERGGMLFGRQGQNR